MKNWTLYFIMLTILSFLSVFSARKEVNSWGPAPFLLLSVTSWPVSSEMRRCCWTGARMGKLVFYKTWRHGQKSPRRLTPIILGLHAQNNGSRNSVVNYRSSTYSFKVYYNEVKSWVYENKKAKYLEKNCVYIYCFLNPHLHSNTVKSKMYYVYC